MGCFVSILGTMQQPTSDLLVQQSAAFCFLLSADVRYADDVIAFEGQSKASLLRLPVNIHFPIKQSAPQRRKLANAVQAPPSPPSVPLTPPLPPLPPSWMHEARRQTERAQERLKHNLLLNGRTERRRWQRSCCQRPRQACLDRC